MNGKDQASHDSGNQARAEQDLSLSQDLQEVIQSLMKRSKIADQLPEWDLEPPQELVNRRKKR